MKRRRTSLSVVILGLLGGILTGVALGADAPASATSRPAEVPNTWSGVERIVAIADVHGDFKQFVKALTAAGVIDAKTNWTGGKTHLVQTGDILDRGPDSKRAMDLVMKLEPQAIEAGGRVHALLGNHELMVMTGDLRYVHPGEYKAFGGKLKFARAMSRSGKYGKWLRGHNAAIKINDVLFMHGGLNKQWMTLSLDRINADIRKALQTGRGRGGLLGSSGPMWYRGWASQHAADVAAQCDPVFKRYGVKRAVIGHTPHRGITPLGDGRVIALDTGMCAYYGGQAAALVIEKNRYLAIYPGRKPLALKVDYKPAAAKSQINIQYPARNFQFPNETNRQRHNVWRPTTMDIGIGYSTPPSPPAGAAARKAG